MKKLTLSISELSEHMYDYIVNYGWIAYAVVSYDEARFLLKELLLYDDVNAELIELESPEYGGYNKEYYVSLTDEFKVSVEKAWHEKNEYRDACYFSIGDGIAFISSDANSKIISTSINCEFIEVEITDTFDDDDLDEDIEQDDDIDDKEVGEIVEKFCDVLEFLFK